MTASPDTARTQLHDPQARGFASDNYAGVHPEVLEAIARANGGHQVSYGEDVYTEHLQELFRAHFGAQRRRLPRVQRHRRQRRRTTGGHAPLAGVVCAESAHINVDECGAPEKVGGLKLLTVPAPLGKLTPESIDPQARGFGDEHRAQPAVVSITQSTELGTALHARPRSPRSRSTPTRTGMAVHLDGARIANAAAALGRAAARVHDRRSASTSSPSAARRTA